MREYANAKGAFTHPHLVNAWSDLSETPLEECRVRFRFLQKGGLLRVGGSHSQSLDDSNIALAIIGALCGGQHLQSAERAKQYAELQCCHDAALTPFCEMTLREALADLLTRARDRNDPWRVVKIDFHLSRPIVEILLVDTRRRENIGGAVVFGDISAPPSPIETVRSLSGAVLEGMAKASATKHPE